MRKSLVLLWLALSLPAIIVLAKQDDEIDKTFHAIWDIDKAKAVISDSIYYKGLTAFDKGDYAEAAKLFEECHNFDALLYHPDNYRNAYASHWLAECLLKMGDSVGYAQHIGGNSGRPVDRRLTVKSDSLGLLAITWAEKDIEESTRLLKESAAIERQVLGSDHPMYANTLMMLSSCLINTQQYADALSVTQELTEIRRNYYGESSVKYGNALAQLSLALHCQGDLESIAKSVALRAPVIEICKAAGDHGNEVMQYYFLVNDLFTLGSNTQNPIEKEQYLQQGLALIPQAAEANDVTELHGVYLKALGNLYSNIANNTEFSSANIAEIIRLSELSLDYYREGEPYGVDPMLTASCLIRLGGAYNMCGDYKKAISAYEEALERMRQHPDEAGIYTIYPLQNLAILYSEHSDSGPQKSVPLLQEAIDLLLKQQKYDPNELIYLYLTKSNANITIGNYQEAKTDLERAEEITDRIGIEKTQEGITLLSLRYRVYANFGYEIECLADLQAIVDMTDEVYPGDKELKYKHLAQLVQKQIDFISPDWEKNYLLEEKLLASWPEAGAYNLANFYSLGAHGYLQVSKYDKAIELINKAIETYTPIVDANNDLLVHFYLKKAEIALYSRDYDEALKVCRETLSISGISKFNQQQAHEIIASAYTGLSDFNQAIASQYTSIGLNAELYGENAPSTLSLLSYITDYYGYLYDYKKSYEIRSDIVDRWEKTTGAGSDSHLAAIIKRESTPGYGNGYKKRDAQLQLLDVIKEKHGENSAAYFAELLNTADAFSTLGLFEEAKDYGERGLEGIKTLRGENNERYQGYLVSSIGWHLYSGDYDKAIERANLAISLTEKYHPTEWERICNAMQWKLKTYEAIFDFGTALYELDKMAEIVRNSVGENSERYLNALDDKSILLHKIGDFEGAIALNTDLLERAKHFPIKFVSEDLAEVAHNNLIMAYTLAGKTEQASSLINEFEESTKNKNDVLLHNFAIAYYTIGNPEKALALSDELMSRDYVKHVNDVDKSNIFVKQGLLRAMSGRAEEGRAMMERGLAMRDSIFNGQGHYMILGLRDMVTVTEAVNDKVARNRYALQLSDVTRNYIKKAFLTMPASSREILWGQYSSFIMNDFPAIAEDSPTSEMASMAYNNLLLGKGLLLNTEREISEIIAESSDNQAQEKFNEYKTNRTLLEYLQTADASKITVNIDSLSRVTDQIEYELLGFCGEFTSALDINWDDVRRSLKPDEAAIEFTTVNDDNKHYLALVLRHNSSSPQVVAYNNIDIAKLWNTAPQKLSKALWQPLSEAIGNAKTVYFSAAGDLHSHPIETLPDFDTDGKLINERWRVSRLSSTRVLMQRNNKSGIHKAAVYGGLRYDADTCALVSDARRYPESRRMSREFIPQGSFDADSTLRSGADYLPASLTEAVAIQKSLDKSGINTAIFTDTLGTETSFKVLSGSGYNLLHIATHGFSWSKREASLLNKLKFLNFSDNQVLQTDDEALSRSGLLFTGANHALRGELMPEGVDDGILLAKEIAALDFRSLDMIILSACETGLGDVTGEGVFGLQRGFKKAGANSIMMSLWKVDDKATQMLMTAFYDKFLKGKTKQEALLLAQKYVREYEEVIELDPDDGMTESQRRRARRDQEADSSAREIQSVKVRPYENPKYWAAFILLDALN
ncbi:MAG: CHAT domain-containing protein [Muribaculaceae bacterium]|nr:CHAT domain-containing protein [Muribaculaceae bacterium]